SGGRPALRGELLVAVPARRRGRVVTLEIDLELPLDRFALEVCERVDASSLGVFGASGAGKTSLLQLVAGLRRPRRGLIRVGDEVWLDTDAGLFVRPEKRRLGYVPQDGLLFPHWNVRRNLLAGAGRVEAEAEAEKTFEETVALLELASLLERSVASLSGGERQRVALGRALCSGPSLLLLDEPMASLDFGLRRRLLPFLERIRAELTVPMLLVSHDPLEVQALCDELLVLARGRVVARGAPRRVLTDPEVFPLAAEQGFENVLAGRVARHDDDTTVVDVGGVPMVVPRWSMPAGNEVLMSLPASDVVLATERPRGVSARNILEAEVTACRDVGRGALVDVDLVTAAGGKPPRLSVQVALSTPAELGLVAGVRVYLLIKATSFRLYGSR
ncbi:MAG: molybdenum ABC transporter ATP-binding protein, partial [Acidobacteriota bacterium]